MEVEVNSERQKLTTLGLLNGWWIYTERQGSQSFNNADWIIVTRWSIFGKLKMLSGWFPGARAPAVRPAKDREATLTRWLTEGRVS